MKRTTRAISGWILGLALLMPLAASAMTSDNNQRRRDFQWAEDEFSVFCENHIDDYRQYGADMHSPIIWIKSMREKYIKLSEKIVGTDGTWEKGKRIFNEKEKEFWKISVRHFHCFDCCSECCRDCMNDSCGKSLTCLEQNCHCLSGSTFARSCHGIYFEETVNSIVTTIANICCVLPYQVCKNGVKKCHGKLYGNQTKLKLIEKDKMKNIKIVDLISGKQNSNGLKNRNNNR